MDAMKATLNMTWAEFQNWRKDHNFTQPLLFADNWFVFKNAVKFDFTVNHEPLWFLS